MKIPSEPEDLFYITYHVGSSQEWEENTSGKMEFRAYGKQPGFSTSSYSEGGDFTNNQSLTEINRGKSFSTEWYDIETPWGNIGVIYYKSTPQIDLLRDFIVYQLLPWIGIVIIVIIVIVRKKRNKREFRN